MAGSGLFRCVESDFGIQIFRHEHAIAFPAHSEMADSHLHGRHFRVDAIRLKRLQKTSFILTLELETVTFSEDEAAEAVA
jgi:hypothetical protein